MHDGLGLESGLESELGLGLGSGLVLGFGAPLSTGDCMHFSVDHCD